MLAERETRRLRVPRPILSRTATPGFVAGQVVGVLSVPDATVEILPKIEGRGNRDVRDALVRMLAVAVGLPVTGDEMAPMATQREDLLEVLVRLFAERLLVAARRGLPHRYRPREEYLPALRGKLDVRRQIVGRTARAGLLACAYDELSVDTPLNRVLRAAVRRLLHVVRSAGNRRRLAELAARFDFVGDSVAPLREPVRLDRTNVAFHRLHGLARLLLGGDWQGTGTGGQDGFALLFAMNDLFEAFVGRCMQLGLAPRSVCLQRQDRHALEGSGRGVFRLRPDIVVDGDIVIDTKWKRLDAAHSTLGVAESDVYQMLAYERAYGARRLVLLYPWHEGLPEAGTCQRWRVPQSGIPFDIATVDVGDPVAVPSLVRRIVRDVEDGA